MEAGACHVWPPSASRLMPRNREPPSAISLGEGVKLHMWSARAPGCDDYVTKPYNPVDLLRLVRRYLERMHSTNIWFVGPVSTRNVNKRNFSCGSRVRLPTLLSTRQKNPRKQTK